MSTLEKVQLLEERIKKAITLIEKLKAENSSLRDEVELLKMHNDELKVYATDYSKSNRLIEEGISNSLTHLEQLEEFTAQKTQQQESSEKEEEDFTFEAEDSEEESDSSFESDEEEESEEKDAPLY